VCENASNLNTKMYKFRVFISFCAAPLFPREDVEKKQKVDSSLNFERFSCLHRRKKKIFISPKTEKIFSRPSRRESAQREGEKKKKKQGLWEERERGKNSSLYFTTFSFLHVN